MDTIIEWHEVLISGGLWGSLMMLLEVFKPRAAGSKNPALYLNLLLIAIAVFVWITGRVRISRNRWPLVTITVTALAAFVLGAIIYRKRIKRLQSNNPLHQTSGIPLPRIFKQNDVKRS